MTAGKIIDGGDPGNVTRSEGGDDGTKSNDKKAVDKAAAPATPKEKAAAKESNTPAQYDGGESPAQYEF